MTSLALRPRLVLGRPVPFIARPRSLTLPAARPTSDSDRLDALLHQVALGDRSAFSDFYDALSGAVFGTALKVLRDRTLAEDAAQEAFVEIWQKAGQWDGAKARASTWALVIAHRRAVDRVRQEEAIRARQERQAPTWSERAHDATAAEVERRADHEQIRGVLDHLTDLQREVVELAYFHAMPYREIAEKLQVPLGTVKTRMRDGLIRLRDTLGVST